MKEKLTMLSVVALLAFFAAAGAALAHKVYVFAWAENGRIFTQSSFSEKRMVAAGRITVSDENGQVLLKGETSEQGMFSFEIPDDLETGLVIKLDAGMGHAAEWQMSRSDIREAKTGQDTRGRTEGELDKRIRQPGVLSTVAGVAVIFVLFFAISFIYRKRRRVRE